MAGRRVLVLLAHPVLERSRVNRRLLEAVRDLDAVTVHDLYEVYPTLAIDVRREQRLLVEHDVVVFQHPFYWLLDAVDPEGVAGPCATRPTVPSTT